MNKTPFIAVAIVFVILLVGYYNAERQRVVGVVPISQDVFVPQPNRTVQAHPCSLMEEEGKRNLCYYNDVVSKNKAELCNTLATADLAIRCLQTVALELKDQNICIKIHENQARDVCYKQVAEAKQDAVLCGSITFVELREECIANISKA